MAEYQFKEYEKAFYFVQRIISSCDSPEEIRACKELVTNFRKRKFKKDIPSAKEMTGFANQLDHAWHNKNNAIRKRVSDEKKKANAKV